MATVILNSGCKMPIIGLGTYKIIGSEIVTSAVESAIAAGYRHIDTAGGYKNEADIGICLKAILPKYGLNREDVFITSKLGPKDHGLEKCRAACLQSIQNLQCDYLDLYLIHWPGGQGLQPGDTRHKDLRHNSWKAMEQLHQEGKIRSIGVSNYLERHIEELLKHSKIPPAVLQIEFHPHLQQRSLVQYCRDKNIFFQAYSSLGTSVDKDKKLLSDPVVNKIATKLNKSPAQILLKWAVQQDIGVLPKSSTKQRIEENIDIFSFSLTEEEMNCIYQIDSSTHYCWNPECVL